MIPSTLEDWRHLKGFQNTVCASACSFLAKQLNLAHGCRKRLFPATSRVRGPRRWTPPGSYILLLPLPRSSRCPHRRRPLRRSLHLCSHWYRWCEGPPYRLERRDIRPELWPDLEEVLAHGEGADVADAGLEGGRNVVPPRVGAAGVAVAELVRPQYPERVGKDEPELIGAVSVWVEDEALADAGPGEERGALGLVEVVRHEI